jgi:hypothetical protein
MEPGIARLMESVSAQFARNAHANLLCSDSETGISVDSGFLEEFRSISSLQLCDEAVDSLAAHACGQFMACVLAINPYVELNDRDSAELTEIYRQSARKLISGEKPETVLSGHHYPALRRWTERKYPDSIRQQLQYQSSLGRISYAEYSPRLQLRVLRLGPRRINGPVMDIGCGEEASLVHYLRDRGIEAYGIDRLLPAEENDFLFRTSWFDYPLESVSPNLLVSHLAFSSHLLYQYNSAGPELANYLERYHTILDALPVGGMFVYTPALDFLEDRLSKERFNVTRWTVTGRVSAARVTRIAV